jgi:multiple sugar transport system permease protein
VSTTTSTGSGPLSVDLGEAPATPRRRRPTGRLRRIVAYVLLTGGGVVMVLPFAWLLSSALKGPENIFVVPPEWIPEPLRWSNFTEVLSALPFLQYLENTLVITFVATAGQVVTSVLCAFAFSRLRWPGRDILFAIVLATLMVPYTVTLIPTFILFKSLNWLDTFLPLTVPYWFGAGSAFFIFLLRQFFMSIPMELSDAARIDGETELGILWRIILPLSKPAMATVALFSFLWSWSDFFGPLIFLTNEDLYTVSLGLVQFQSRYDTAWGQVMAASAVFTLPVLVLFFLAQRQFIEGVTLTGIKG